MLHKKFWRHHGFRCHIVLVLPHFAPNSFILSFYHQAGRSLEALIQKAQGHIPADQWASTPIALKATAGLRLLPKDQADAILNEVKLDFRSFNISRELQVKIKAVESIVKVIVHQVLFFMHFATFLSPVSTVARINCAAMFSLPMRGTYTDVC